MRPFMIAALGVMVVFVVWLFAQMTRNPTTTRYALTIGASSAAAGIVLALSLARRKR